MNVHIIGRGKVGRSLCRALREAGRTVSIEAGREPERQGVAADVVLLAVRDDAIASVAEGLAPRLLHAPSQTVAHLAGALGLEPLQSLRDAGASVARAHPAVSFVDGETDLEGRVVTVTGAAPAASALRTLFTALGARVVEAPELDAARYHAALALAANGLGALLAEATSLLTQAGLEGAPEVLLAPLLRGVIDNAERVGAAGALSGPVRRGAVSTVERHRASLRDRPATLQLYDALVRSQLTVASALAEADSEALEAIAALLDEAG